jgi:hypothetical protein
MGVQTTPGQQPPRDRSWPIVKGILIALGVVVGLVLLATGLLYAACGGS